MTTVRCFIAIECPGEIEEEILKIQQELKMALRAMPNTPPPPIRLKGTREVDKRGGMDGPDRLGIKWVRPAGFHLTLKFLGNVAQEKLSGIVDVLGKVTPPFPAFTVSVGGIGVFPNARDPRVIWIGVRSVGDDLVRLQKGIEEGLESLGFAREGRSFHPHFTLGRLGSFGRARRQFDSRPDREALVKWIAQNEQREYGRFEVKEVLLMKSDLKPGGAVYTPLAAVGLEG
jgi:2'-5' RNA ligase